MGISTTTEWQQIDDRMVLMPGNHMNHLSHGLNSATTTTAAATAAVAAGRVMETQQPLKCPRCDSSNTKFCYYNNYSLSQPRHFCKACKRYWTRGGTLRNVPVGGGCRKNKRVKKPSSSSTSSATVAATTAAMVSDPQSFPLHIPNFSLPTSSSPATIDPIFFGVHQNSTDLNIPSSFPSFLKRLDQRSGGVDNYNLNPNFNNSLGLCFPTAGLNQDYNAGMPFHTPVMSSTSLVHDFSLLGSSLSSSLLASTLRQPKLGLNSPGWTVGYDDIPETVGNSGGLGLFKGVKEEDGNINGGNQDGRLQWQIPTEPNQLVNSVDGSNSFYWNVNPAGIATGWSESTAGNNCGSSVAPLI